MLLKQECNMLNTIHSNFYGHGVSPVDASLGAIKGRPYGGVGILWRDKIDSVVTITHSPYDWLCGIKISNTCQEHYLLNVYLPYEKADNFDLYNDCLAKLIVFISELNTTCVSVFGDFNADLANSSIFGDILTQYCHDNNLHILDQMFLNTDTYTYVSSAWGTTSWIDHIICTSDAVSCFSEVQILYHCIGSDHHPCKMLPKY